MDPAQVFGAAPQAEPEQPGPPEEELQGQPQPGAPGGNDDVDPDGIDLEGAIANAIETGCEMAVAAAGNSADEFMRFAQGVNYLATGLGALQPQQDSNEAQVTIAEIRAQAQRDVATINAEAAAYAAASRPPAQGSSARG